jgi:hypothetical protein
MAPNPSPQGVAKQRIDAHTEGCYQPLSATPAHVPEILYSPMREDAGFNATLLFGCIVGASVGYHIGATVLAVDGAVIGLLGSAVIAAIIAEISYGLESVTSGGAWLLDRVSPVITLLLLIAVAQRLW